jgi:hypothetical protein
MHTETIKPTAQEFARAFLESYNHCRRLYSGQEWATIWGTNNLWNWFMMWTTNRPGLLKSEAVMAKTASTLGLAYWEREPLKLDGALYINDETPEHGFPFPLVVALEHENDSRTFGSEIQKLLSVRCPLKVGVTYSLNVQEHASTRECLQQLIERKYRRIAAIVGEDAKTENLFLLGCEEALREITWYALTFSAAAGGVGSRFLPCEASHAAQGPA